MSSVSVSSILKEGTIVAARLENSVTWYQNIIYKVNNDVVDIALLDGYIKGLLMPGMSMVLKLTNEYFEYLFDGTILDVSLESPSFVTLHINKAEELINSREFPRFDIYLPSYVKSSWSKAYHFAILTNLSLTGMAFRSKARFDNCEECDVTIYLPENIPVDVKGKVIRKYEKHSVSDYSMHFTEMDEESSNLIYSYFMSLEDTTKSLQSEFSRNLEVHV